MPFSGLTNLMGAAGAVPQGFEQGAMSGLQIQQGELQMQQTKQQISAAPLLFMQQRAQGSPELLHDSQFINEVNKWGKPFGMQYDPQQGIEPSFLRMNLLQIVNPTQAARIAGEMELKFQQGLPAVLRAPGDPIANLRIYIKSQPSSVDTSGAEAVMSDPMTQQALETHYQVGIEQAMSLINKNQSLSDLDIARANRTAALMPLEATRMVAQAGLYTAQTGAQNALADWRQNDMYIKAGTLAERIRNDANNYSAKMAAVSNTQDANAERRRHDLATELHNYVNDNRQLMNSYFGALINEQQNGQFSGEGIANLIQTINGTDNPDGTHTPGIGDLLKSMDTGASQMMTNPTPQPKALPAGQKVTPRTMPAKGVNYDTGRRLFVPNKNIGVYNGYIYKKQGNQLINTGQKYQPAQGDYYVPSNQQ